MARDDGVATRQVIVTLSELAFEAVGGEAAAPARMESALRCYLGDKGTDRPAWPYPGFLRGSEPRREARVEFQAREDLWQRFEEEAARQGVTVEQLAEHAAFYFTAELKAGRITQRILDDLESSEGGGKA